jgi:hypothetical protein
MWYRFETNWFRNCEVASTTGLEARAVRSRRISDAELRMLRDSRNWLRMCDSLDLRLGTSKEEEEEEESCGASKSLRPSVSGTKMNNIPPVRKRPMAIQTGTQGPAFSMTNAERDGESKFPLMLATWMRRNAVALLGVRTKG